MSGQIRPWAQARRINLSVLLALALIIVFSFTCYWPGTSGDFILDDALNLGALQKFGGVHDLDSLRLFVFQGVSGPTGRPLALLSFLLDGQTWPSDPFAFKRTNILIHTLNGMLIFAVIFKLFQMLGKRNDRAVIIAFLGAILWTLHPLNVSTVLYIIQRMTELTALFTLAGIWCYLHGRQKLPSSPGPAYVWMSAGVLVFGLLATLCKENGVLLPLYILALELTLLQSIQRPPHWRYWAIPFLATPALIIFAYLGYVTDHHLAHYAQRDFSLYERLLTEPRVLLDYVAKIIFPVHTPGLFFDDYQHSTALLSPISTLLAILALTGSVIASLLFRHKYPVLSFAVLWFLAGHLLESSVLSLELYFEHRNYLPMLGILIALVYYAEKLFFAKKRLFVSVAGLVIFTLAFTTWQHSNTWGNNDRLIAQAAENQPNSLRAQIAYTQNLFSSADSHAMSQLEETLVKFPRSLGIATAYVNVLCQQQRLREDDFINLLHKAQTLPLDSYLGISLPQLSDNVITGKCRQLTANGMVALITAVSENSLTPIDQQKRIRLLQLKAEMHVKQGNLRDALRSLDEVFKLNPSMDTALRQAELLTSANLLDAALSWLNRARLVDKSRSPLQPSRQAEIDTLRKEIESRKTASINR